MMSPFIPDDFEAPPKLETEAFRLRMLTVGDVVKDYDAVMTSVARLKAVFARRTTWPTGLTLEQDLADLGWHQVEFQRRRSFAYTVMNLAESQCLGCVYVNPTGKRGYDAVAYLWVRDSEFQKGLDPILFDAVRTWLARDWPFRQVAFPGRVIDWESWDALAESLC
jgi:heme oxygenase